MSLKPLASLQLSHGRISPPWAWIRYPKALLGFKGKAIAEYILLCATSFFFLRPDSEPKNPKPHMARFDTSWAKLRPLLSLVLDPQGLAQATKVLKQVSEGMDLAYLGLAQFFTGKRGNG